MDSGIDPRALPPAVFASTIHRVAPVSCPRSNEDVPRPLPVIGQLAASPP